MDLLTPIGKGQRGLIVAPPRTGKTILLQQLAAAVATNHPEMHLMVLLIDERPEEVTEMRRSVRGEVIASSSDHSTEEHIRLAQLAVDRAKRIAESGGQVFDPAGQPDPPGTRLQQGLQLRDGRCPAASTSRPSTSPSASSAPPGRSTREGSLTVLATALIETGSRMDEIIFQEFKGTGNMEVVLDRRLADRRVWPAIDIQQSGTRKEERILDPETLSRVTLLRRTLADMKPAEAMEALVRQLSKSPTNADFLARIAISQKAN